MEPPDARRRRSFLSIGFKAEITRDVYQVIKEAS